MNFKGEKKIKRRTLNDHGVYIHCECTSHKNIFNLWKEYVAENPTQSRVGEQWILNSINDTVKTKCAWE